MKTVFLSALMVIAVMATAFVGYGVHLNRQSASYISAIQARRIIQVTGSRLVNREIQPEIHIGSIALQTENMVDVISQVEGTLIAIHVVHGQEVREGEPLCRLDNKFLPPQIAGAEAEIAKAEANLIYAISSLERLRKIRSSQAVSATELEMAIAQEKTAQSELLAKRALLNQLIQQKNSLNVTAPMQGDVLQIYGKSGSFLPLGTPLLLLGNFSNLTFSVEIPDSQIKNLLPIVKDYELVVDLKNDRKNFKTSYSGGYTADIAFEARLLHISPPLSEPALFRQTLWSVANPQKILEPGLYANASLRSSIKRNVLAVPRKVLRTLEDPALFILDKEGHLARRKVKLGFASRDYVEIAEGLQEGEVIIESNVDDLKLGLAINVQFVEEKP